MKHYIPQWLEKPGPFSWIVTVDPDQKVTEGDETNNKRTLYFMVKPQPAGAAQPDLSIGKCAIQPANPSTDDRITLNVEYKNIGKAAGAIPGGVKILSYELGGKTDNDRFGLDIVINPGETRFALPILAEPGSLKAGNYILKIRLDPDNRCPESNESNNEFTLNFTVAPSTVSRPDLIITQVIVEPMTQLRVYQAFKLKTVIKNQGQASAVFAPQDIILSTFGGVLNAPPTGLTIQPGETKTLWIDCDGLQEGTHFQDIGVDPDNMIRESNEVNNGEKFTIYVKRSVSPRTRQLPGL